MERNLPEWIIKSIGKKPPYTDEEIMQIWENLRSSNLDNNTKSLNPFALKKIVEYMDKIYSMQQQFMGEIGEWDHEI